MNTVVLELSDEALVDLHTVQLQLRAKWKDAPDLESYQVTESDAVRVALAMLVDGEAIIADLVPSGRA